MHNQTYIFITGIFRSGTTLLTRALSAHPEINIIYQPFTAFFRAALEKFWLSNGCTHSKPMGDPLLVEQFYEKFRDNVLSLRFTQNEINEIKSLIRKDAEIDSDEKQADAYTAFDEASGNSLGELLYYAMLNLRHIASQNEHGIIGIKEVWCEDFLPALLANDNMTVKCIHLIRDPRAIVVSRNYGEYLRQGCGGQKYPLLFIARSWRRSIALSRKLQGLKNYTCIRYEDFVTSPEAVLMELCNFLSVDFNPAMVNYSQYRGGSGQPWRGNVDSRLFDGINSESSTRWKQIISEDDLFLCEFLCAPEMEYAGYQVVTNAKDTDKFLALQEDVSAKKSWLCRLGHCLTEEQKTVEMQRKASVI